MLEFARGLTEQGRLEGETGESLLQYLDSMDAFDPDDLQRMAKAIEEDCEQINPNDW